MTATPLTGAGNVTVASWASGSAQTIAKPANLAVGDTLIIVGYNQVAGSSFATPTGGFSTKYHATASGTRALYLFELAITDAATLAAQPASYELDTSGGSGRGCAVAFRGTGFDNVNIVDALPSSDVYGASSATTVSLPSINVTDAGAVVLACVFINGSSSNVYTETEPGFTPLANVNTTVAGSTSTLDVQFKTAGSVGATGAVTATFKVGGVTTAAPSYGGFLISLSPASTVSVPYTLMATTEENNDPPRVLLEVAGASGTSVTVTRVDSAGNRAPIRAANPASLNSGGRIVYDYEAPFGQPVTYEAKVGTTTSVSESVTLPITNPWLIHPGIPSLSLQVSVSAMGDETFDTNQGVHRPLGRSTAVTITDGVRQAASFELTLSTSTRTDETNLAALLADTSTLLLQVPGDERYQWISVGSVSKARLVPVFSNRHHLWTLSCVVSSRPAGLLQSQRTWQDVVAGYLSWNDVLGAYSTWRDLITDGSADVEWAGGGTGGGTAPGTSGTTPAMPTLPAPGSFATNHAFTDFSLLSHTTGFVSSLSTIGSGSATEAYYMTAGSSTQVAKVPAQSASPATNPLTLMVGGSGGPAITSGIEWANFSLVATAQGHLFNGIRIGYASAPYLHDLVIKGMPGDSNAPPGETFSINLWHTTNAVLHQVVVDGRDASGTPVASSLIGLNNAVGTVVRYSRAQYANTGIAFTGWQSQDITVTDCDFSNNRRAINLERCSGTITLTRVNVSGQWRSSQHISCNSDQASARLIIVDPIVDAGVPLRILAGGANVPLYNGKPNLQQQSDVSVFVGGVDVTHDPTYVTFL